MKALKERSVMKKATAVIAAGLLTCSMALVGCSSGGSGSSSSAGQPETVSVTDAAGRTVDIPSPDNLTSVYSTSPIGQIYLFTMAPEKAGGTNTDYTESELKYLPESVKGLENYGT